MTRSISRLMGPATVAALLLVACQSVSVEEARRIAARSAEVPFVPAPATIDDVRTRLEQGAEPAAQPRMTADRIAAGGAEPDSTRASVEEKANFYYQRGLAAINSGRMGQALADLARAAELGRSTTGVATERMIHALAVAHEYGGKYSDHFRYREESMEGSRPAVIFGRSCWLATNFGAAGDLSDARRALSRATSHMSAIVELETAEGPDRPWGPVVRTLFATANGEILLARGMYTEAEAFYRHALREAARAMEAGAQKADYVSFIEVEDGKRYAKTQAHQRLSAGLILQGRLAEAEVEARNAVGTMVARYGRDSQYTAAALVTLGDVLDAQGRMPEAQMLSRLTLEIYDRIGAAPESLKRAQARRIAAAALARGESWREALGEYDRIERDMAADRESLAWQFGGDLDWALTLVRNHQARRAVDRLRPRVGALEGRLGRADYQVGEARGMLAVALAEAGEVPEALEEFGRAVPVLLARARGGDDERIWVTARQHRREAILEAYVSLLARVWGTGAEQSSGVRAIGEAFMVADAVRSGVVQRALGAGAARSAAREPGLADLVRRDQDAEKQLTTLYGLLADVTTRPKDSRDNTDQRPSARAVGGQIDQLSRAREAFRTEIAKRFPDYADLVDPKPTTLEQARAALRPGEALLAIHVGREQTLVWAVPPSGPAAFAAVPLTRGEAQALVDRLRRGLEPSADVLHKPPVFDGEAAHQLYRALLGPVESGWRGARVLVVAPHGPVGQLPFGVLLTAPVTLRPTTTAVPFSEYRDLSWLARTVAVTHVPSVASLRILRTVPPGDPSRRPFVGFGDPYFSLDHARQAAGPPSASATASRGARVTVRATGGAMAAQLARLPRLPETAEEIRHLAAALGADPERDVYLGARANEQAVKSPGLATYRIVAFATHGLVPGDLDGLTQPALAMAAPEVAGVEGDGVLTMEEILGLRLNADWVVLSACNTAGGRGAGAEAVSGLGRAFFYAGSRALLVTHWPVESTSAQALTTELFRRQAAHPGLGRAEALRLTMLSLMDGPGFVDPDSGQPVFSYAHPMFWAPFALVGDGGGELRGESALGQ